MKLNDEIRVDATPEQVWSCIGDPLQWLGFNPNVASVKQCVGVGPVVDAWYEIEVDIVYELEPSGSGVRVRERFEIRNHGIPWIVVVLMQWIHRWGTPQDPTALQRLRELLRPTEAKCA